MKNRRRGNPNVNGEEYCVNSEYSTEEIDQQDIEDMKKDGLSCIYAQVSEASLSSIFKTRNLFSTSTRYSKGIFVDGMSSSTDLSNGGGKSVFTRMHTKNSQKTGNWYTGVSKPAIIFPPEILQRVDCYAYPDDKFGSLSPSTFDNRVSPEQLLKKMNTHYNCSNEIMFQDAIPMTEAKYIVCQDPGHCIQNLKNAGILEIGGQSLEKSVITPANFQSLSNI